MFIRSHGPNPLTTQGLLRAVLDEKCEGNEYYLVTESKKLFSSKNVQTQMQEAKKEFSIFDFNI